MKVILSYVINSFEYLGLSSYIPAVATTLGVSTTTALIITTISVITPIISTIIYFREGIKSLFINIFSRSIEKSKVQIKSTDNLSDKNIPVVDNGFSNSVHKNVLHKAPFKKESSIESNPELKIITPLKSVVQEGIFYNKSQNKNPQKKSPQHFRKVSSGHVHGSKLSSGRNTGKEIVTKIPVTKEDKKNQSKNKFKYQWIAKIQTPYESIREIVSADAFIVLVGENCSPKYRLVKDDQSQVWTVTKILGNFVQAKDIIDKKQAEIQSSEDRNKRIRALEYKDLGLSIYSGKMQSNKIQVYTEAYIFSQTKEGNHFDEYITCLNLSDKKESDEYEKAREIYKKINRKYLFIIKDYIDLVSSLENFNQIIATSLLFGKDDMHYGNWGVIEKDNKQYAAMVDHGEALKSGFSMDNMLYKYGHRKEKIVTREFAKTCIDVSRDFDIKKDQVKAAFMAGINRAREFYEQDKIKTIDQYMDILESNKSLLIQLSYQIRVEIAITEGNVEDLKEYLSKMDSKYVTLNQNPSQFVPISRQNYRDGFANLEIGNFILLIKSRLESDCDRSCFFFEDEKGYVRSKEYESMMTEEDKEIEKKLLDAYFEVANEKNPMQARLNEEKNKNNAVGKSI